MKKKIAVKEVLMHIRPPLDEIAAYVLLYLADIIWGIELFSGFREAPVRFVESDVSGTNEEFDRAGIVAIGVGGANKLRGDKDVSRFDEHRSNGRIQLHGRTTCATELVAEYLGIADKPEVKQLIQEVRLCDTTDKATPSCFAELIKVAHRASPGNSLGILFWGLKAVEAIILRAKYSYAQGEKEATLATVFGLASRTKLKKVEPRVREYIEKQLGVGTKNSPLTVTEPRFIIESLQRRGQPLKGDEGVVGWLQYAVCAMKEDQEALQQDIKMLSNGKYHYRVQALLGHKDLDLKLIAVTSDSTRIAKAARCLHVDLVLVKNSQGHVYIGTKRKGSLNIANVVRMIRWLALPLDKKNISWDGLNQSCNHPEVPGWYYQKEAEALFHGSFTHACEATPIHISSLTEVMQFGFHPEGVKIWKARHGVFELRRQQRSGKRRSQRPIHSAKAKGSNKKAQAGAVTKAPRAKVEVEPGTFPLDDKISQRLARKAKALAKSSKDAPSKEKLARKSGKKKK